jgi:hypothetical protein
MYRSDLEAWLQESQQAKSSSEAFETLLLQVQLTADELRIVERLENMTGRRLPAE